METKNLKLSQLVNSKDALLKIAKMSFPFEMAWSLKDFVFKVDEQLRKFDELRSEKIIALGAENEKKEYQVTPENIPAWNEWIVGAFNKDIEMSVPTIKYSVLKDQKDLKGNPITITAEELMLLDWLIVE